MITILSAAWSFLTSKLGMILVIILCIISMYFLKIQLNASKAETAQKSDDLKNSNFTITETKAKNGQLIETITSLQVNKSELSDLNTGLTTQLGNMGVQLNQLQSVTDILSKQQLKVDTIRFLRDTSKAANQSIDTGKWNGLNGVYNGSWSDKWAKFTSKINLQSGKAPYLSQINILLADSIIIAHETKRKRVWLFFHRTIGVETHITSNSPYFHVDTIQDYIITK